MTAAQLASIACMCTIELTVVEEANVDMSLGPFDADMPCEAEPSSRGGHDSNFDVSVTVHVWFHEDV